MLLGKYDRQLDKINVDIQLIDLATWEQIDKKNMATDYGDVSKMKNIIADEIRNMISAYLPKGENQITAIINS